MSARLLVIIIGGSDSMVEVFEMFELKENGLTNLLEGLPIEFFVSSEALLCLPTRIFSSS